MKALFLLFATVTPLMASLIVPPPDIALKEATFVASGKVKTREDGIFLVPIEVLKIVPDQKTNKEYKVEDILFTEWYYASSTARIAKSDTILFVGGFDSKTGSIRPIFSMSSVWPNGTIPEYLKIRNFDECLSFTKEVLHNEKKVSTK